MKTKLTFEELGCRRLLARGRAGRSFAADLYRGCEHDCLYCEARKTHEFLSCSPQRDFGTRIFVKRGAPEVFARELERKVQVGDRIVFGVVSDPYQPAERREKLVRACLEIFGERPGVGVRVATKSDLVTRDLDLLVPLASTNDAKVTISLSTLSPRRAAKLEPGAPSPARRLRAVRILSRAGVPVGVDLAPILPGRNDTLGDLAAMADAVSKAGAVWLGARALRLPAGARRGVLAHLEREQPILLGRYRRRYRGRADPPTAYQARLRAMVAALRVARGLEAGPDETTRSARDSVVDRRDAREAQLALPFASGGPRAGSFV